MQTACPFDEIVLYNYLRGEAAPAQQTAIEASPACRAEAKRLARQLAAMFRLHCPDVATLVAYEEGRIADSTLALIVRQHVAICPHCAEEHALLAKIDAVPMVTPSPLRRVVALFQPPLARATALRGDLLLYTTAELAVHLRVRQAIGHAGMWTVRGQVRTADGRLATNQIEAVEAHAADGTTVGAALETAGFRFERLPAGLWTLMLQTAEDEIVIEQFAVGDESLSAFD